jgi:hypothetical protein
MGQVYHTSDDAGYALFRRNRIQGTKIEYTAEAATFTGLWSERYIKRRLLAELNDH